jgi:outer membrane protein OmpA-like peptidoglycan-associated protein
VFEVSDRAGELVELDVVLQPLEDGVADLTVRVVDPDGVPLSDVDVLVDGRPVGTTSPRGELTLLGLQDGFRTLRIEGQLLTPVEGQFEIRPGGQVADVTARWVPGVVEVRVRDPSGAPEDALVAFDGPEPRSPVALGSDGRELVVLPEGGWSILVSSPTWGSQVRQLEVVHGGGRRRRVQVDLLPTDDSGGQLTLVVTDPRGGMVDEARVQLRGVPVGATSEGRAELQGLALGAAEVRVEAEALSPTTRTVDIGGITELTVPLPWAPGALEVVVTGPERSDDVLLFVTGEQPRPPVGLDPDGTRLLGLEPGTWWVLASAERYRAEEQRIELSEAAELSRLEIALQPADDALASLLVRVVDEGGSPVAGVEVRRGEQRLGVTSPSGALRLDDLDPGPVTLSLGDTRLTAAIPLQAELKAGSQTRQIVVPYKPRPVRIAVVDASGAPAVGASVRITGRDDLAVGEVDATGTVEIGLVPGAWRVTASVEGGGGASSLVLSPGIEPVELRVEVASISSAFTGGGLTLSDPVRFDLDQATLRPEASPILDDIARLLQSQPEMVLVEIGGHTDDQGGPTYNQRLSERRAEAVRDALVERGVAPERMVARGYGLTRPVTLDRSDASRARNRRVEVVILDER